MLRYPVLFCFLPPGEILKSGVGITFGVPIEPTFMNALFRPGSGFWQNWPFRLPDISSNVCSYPLRFCLAARRKEITACLLHAARKPSLGFPLQLTSAYRLAKRLAASRNYKRSHFQARRESYPDISRGAPKVRKKRLPLQTPLAGIAAAPAQSSSRLAMAACLAGACQEPGPGPYGTRKSTSKNNGWEKLRCATENNKRTTQKQRNS